jgi:AcrR family transcriptional regulator
MTAMRGTGKPLRADAERNRRRILDAAREVFAARGLDASLDEIAAHAGVGVGTVYRRFADKGDLIDALFEDKVAELATAAREALAVEDPWEGFTTFMTRVCEQQATDRGFKQALLGGAPGCRRIARARNTVAPYARQLLERAQASGQARADIDPADLQIIYLALGLVADATRDVEPDYWRRTLTVLFDGLATARDAPTPLPADPLDPDAYAASLTSRLR